MCRQESLQLGLGDDNRPCHTLFIPNRILANPPELGAAGLDLLRHIQTTGFFGRRTYSRVSRT
jgi:hypothetical protein